MKKDEGHTHNHTSKVVKWLVDKILPWALIGVIGFGFEMWAWRVQVNAERVQVNAKLEDQVSTEWKVGVDNALKYQGEEIVEIKKIIADMKRKMDIAVSTAAGGHVTHREARIDRDDIIRRLERLEPRGSDANKKP